MQIWFQNRRQNDRRKSKPLQPHELIPHFRNGIPLEAGSQLPSPRNSQETPTKNGAGGNAHNMHTSPRQSDLKSILNDSDPPTSSSPSMRKRVIEKQSPDLSTPPSSFETPAQRPSQQKMTPTSADSASQTQLSKKRSHEQMTGNVLSTPVHSDSPHDPRSLRRTSSFVRLAVSADGSVKVRVNDETTPSPPKRRPPPPPNMSARKSSGFSRAQSDLGSTFSFKDASPAVAGVLGRSRDARTWEFYCDRGARSSLAARAEEEATGSAVGALGLMRSASQRKAQALSPNPARQNKIRRSYSKLKTKPSLSRTQSSLARLQSSDGTYDETGLKLKKPAHHRQSSSGDSDKENWLPGTRESVHDLRRVQATPSRSATLQEGGAAVVSTPVGAHDQENRPAAPPGKEKGDDLDCVQGLLSLSQGAWR